MAYATFGSGPGLAALPVVDGGGKTVCQRGACTCTLGAQKNGCCCNWKKALLKKFPALAEEKEFMALAQSGGAGACSLSSPCAESHAGALLTAPFRHTQPRGPRLTPSDALGLTPSAPKAWRPDHVRDAPEPVPKGRTS